MYLKRKASSRVGDHHSLEWCQRFAFAITRTYETNKLPLPETWEETNQQPKTNASTANQSKTMAEQGQSRGPAARESRTSSTKTRQRVRRQDKPTENKTTWCLASGLVPSSSWVGAPAVKLLRGASTPRLVGGEREGGLCQLLGWCPARANFWNPLAFLLWCPLGHAAPPVSSFVTSSRC